MILVYAKEITPRFRYIAKLLLKELLGQELRFTTDQEEYIQATLPKINYSRSPVQSGVNIQAASLTLLKRIFFSRRSKPVSTRV
ncbi:MAG: hypothetical protein U5L96_10400 [Owenweeksia sp.]|nr:hypothetical protein [Owenweeksia sp.]